MSWFSTIVLSLIVMWQNWIIYKERRRTDEREEKLTNAYESQNEIYFTRCLAEIKKDDSVRVSQPPPLQQLNIHKVHQDILNNRLGRRTDEIEAELAALQEDNDGA